MSHPALTGTPPHPIPYHTIPCHFTTQTGGPAGGCGRGLPGGGRGPLLPDGRLHPGPAQQPRVGPGQRHLRLQRALHVLRGAEHARRGAESQQGRRAGRDRDAGRCRRAGGDLAGAEHRLLGQVSALSITFNPPLPLT